MLLCLFLVFDNRCSYSEEQCVKESFYTWCDTDIEGFTCTAMMECNISYVDYCIHPYLSNQTANGPILYVEIRNCHKVYLTKETIGHRPFSSVTDISIRNNLITFKIAKESA